MIDLSTTYLGLRLRSPLLASAGPLSQELDNVRRMEDSGLAAVVLHSLFEEQIELESNTLDRFLSGTAESYAEALTYFPDMASYNVGPDGYLEHLRRLKEAVRIPVIGSLNGISAGGWTRYARLIQEAGADALELNIYSLPTDPRASGAQLEQEYVDLVRQVRADLTIPVAVKLGFYFSSIPQMAHRLDEAGANGLVLFNRFYQPDFDLETLEVIPHLTLSNPYELLLRLHWVAILFGSVRADLAITGGIHAAGDVLKAMMAGARAAMMTSCLLKNGIPHARYIEHELLRWMEEHEYESIRQMQGSMSCRCVSDTTAFERANYMKVLSSYTLRRPAAS
jgi:dihydroorotate dehydrogenase (fumarate)